TTVGCIGSVVGLNIAQRGWRPRGQGKVPQRTCVAQGVANAFNEQGGSVLGSAQDKWASQCGRYISDQTTSDRDLSDPDARIITLVEVNSRTVRNQKRNLWLPIVRELRHCIYRRNASRPIPPNNNHNR